MKSILISISPKGCAKTLNGEKTIDIHRTAPKEWKDYLSGDSREKPKPMTGYIYCTQGDEELYEAFMPFGGKAPYQTKAKGQQLISLKQGNHLNGKVVAKFTLREVEKLERYTGVYIPETILHTKSMQTRHRMEKETCLTMDEIWEYTNGNGYAWHISDLVIFDKPKELSDFKVLDETIYHFPTGTIERTYKAIKRPPQSWFYVEVRE